MRQFWLRKLIFSHERHLGSLLTCTTLMKKDCNTYLHPFMEASPILSSEPSPLLASSPTPSPISRSSDIHAESEDDKSGAKRLCAAQKWYQKTLVAMRGTRICTLLTTCLHCCCTETHIPKATELPTTMQKSFQIASPRFQPTSNRSVAYQCWWL